MESFNNASTNNKSNVVEISNDNSSEPIITKLYIRLDDQFKVTSYFEKSNTPLEYKRWKKNNKGEHEQLPEKNTKHDDTDDLIRNMFLLSPAECAKMIDTFKLTTEELFSIGMYYVIAKSGLEFPIEILLKEYTPIDCTIGTNEKNLYLKEWPRIVFGSKMRFVKNTLINEYKDKFNVTNLITAPTFTESVNSLKNNNPESLLSSSHDIIVVSGFLAHGLVILNKILKEYYGTMRVFRPLEYNKDKEKNDILFEKEHNELIEINNHREQLITRELQLQMKEKLQLETETLEKFKKQQESIVNSNSNVTNAPKKNKKKKNKHNNNTLNNSNNNNPINNIQVDNNLDQSNVKGSHYPVDKEHLRQDTHNKNLQKSLKKNNDRLLNINRNPQVVNNYPRNITSEQKEEIMIQETVNNNNMLSEFLSKELSSNQPTLDDNDNRINYLLQTDDQDNRINYPLETVDQDNINVIDYNPLTITDSYDKNDEKQEKSIETSSKDDIIN